MKLKSKLLFVSFLWCLALPLHSHAHITPPLIAQVIVGTNSDSARSAVSDEKAAQPKGNDYSAYAPKEGRSSMWIWITALNVMILLLILFRISRTKKKK